MKKYILMAAVLSAALTVLTACSNWDIEIRNPYDVSSESSENSSESSEESSEPEQEQDPESEKIRVIGVSSWEVESDLLNEEGFGFGMGADLDFQWISETKALFFSYNIEDPMAGSGCTIRVFLHDNTKKELRFIKEFYFDSTPEISVYTREQSSRIVFSKKLSSLVFSLDYETLEAEEWEEDIGITGVSPMGLYAETFDTSLTVRDVEARENALYVVDVPADYNFISWSAKGGYALLQKGYDGGDYLIADLAEGKTTKINLNGYAQWCGEEGYIAVFDYNEKTAEIIDLFTGEAAKTEYLGDVLLYEKDFTLFFSDDRSEVLLRDNLTGKVFETGALLPSGEGYSVISAKYNPERETLLIEAANEKETEIYSVKVYYGKEGETPKFVPEPEREPKPDSDFGIEPATAEEAEEFMNSEAAVDDLFRFASWVGEKNFESPKDVFSSYTLWWFNKELYIAMGEEEALYENGHFFAIDVELAEKYFKRHFGMDEDDVKDDYNSAEKGAGYKLPVSGGGAPNKFLSAKVESIEENRVKYTVLLLIRADELGKIFAITEMTCDVFKDAEGMFLRLVSNEVTEEFGEASFEDQAKYLTSRIVTNLGEKNIKAGIRITDSESIFNFIVEMQPSLNLGERFDRNSPYLGDFYRDGAGYHFPVSSMKKVANEVFGIGNLTEIRDKNFEYDEEKKEYVSGLEWGISGFGAKAEKLETYVNGDIYTVRFTLMVIENVNGDPEWVESGRYKMNFRLVDGEYLRFIGFNKA